jgi:hypothetical protein
MDNTLNVFDENGKPLSIEDVFARIPPITPFVLPGCTRLEVIDEDKGRAYIHWEPSNRIRISMQDEGRTIKLFVKTL